MFQTLNDPRLSAQRLLTNETWKSLVVLRDPLERLVAGFDDKCLTDERHWCEGSNTSNFHVFANRVIRKISKGNTMRINRHYRPQYVQCGLKEYFDFYDYVIYFDKANIAKETLNMLKNEGLEQIFFNWNGLQNETLFSTKTVHSNLNNTAYSVEERAAFYSKYYDKELANKTINAYRQDYEILKIKYPEWIKYLKI